MRAPCANIDCLQCRVFVQPVSLILSSPTRRKSAGKTRTYGKRAIIWLRPKAAPSCTDGTVRMASKKGLEARRAIIPPSSGILSPLGIFLRRVDQSQQSFTRLGLDRSVGCDDFECLVGVKDHQYDRRAAI